MTNIITMKESSRLTAVQRFRRLLKLDRKEITQVYVYALFNGLVNLSLPLGLQAIINLIQGGEISNSWMIMVGIVIAGVTLMGFFQYMQLRIVENISQKIFARSAFEFAYRFPKINNQALHNYYAPELANRFFDTITIQKSLPKLLIDFSLGAFQILLGLLVLSMYHSFFVFFAILLITMVFFLINYIAPMGLKTSLKESKYKYDVAYWLEEVARTKISFKLNPDNNINVENTDNKVVNYINAREGHFNILALQFFWLTLFKVLISAAFLIIGGVLVFRQEMNIGQFVAAEIIILLILASIEKIITSLESIYDMLTAIEKIGYISDLPLDKVKTSKYEHSLNKNIDILIDGISYTFNDAKKKTIDNLDLSIPAGSKVGIFGENGSGKTTLLNIICGLIEPDEGSIFFNGVSPFSIDVHQLRKNTGYALSSLEIFSGTIFENVSLGKPGIGIDEVMSALEKVKLREYVSTLPMGLDTKLDPEGKKIALSIANKVCIARAIVGTPKLIVMDSPLDHLDVEDKRSIMAELTSKNNKWTLIVTDSDQEWKNTGVTIPTWYGIELKSYYDRTGGEFVNSSDALPNNGLFTMGISFPLARGLVLDERRFELKRAKIFTESTQAIQQIMLNDLYYDAANAYLNWQQAYALTEIAKEGLQFADVRFNSTKSLFELGDKPSIDTLEIFILKTVREQELIEAQQNLINARIDLNNFLWIDGQTPLELDSLASPEIINQESFKEQLNLLRIADNWIDRHPDINLGILKINELELENRLNRENLKPDVRINYNPLINASSNYLPIGYNPNDFKLGASFYMPLFLRKERGKVAFTNAKIYENQFNLSAKRLEINNKFLSYINNTDYLLSQLELISKNVVNYNIMLQSENRLFDLGESSVFLVNSREVSFLQSKIKEMETKIKVIKNRIAAIYVANELIP